MSRIIRDLEPQTVESEGLPRLLVAVLLWVPALVLGSCAFICRHHGGHMMAVAFGLGAVGFCYVSASCFFSRTGGEAAEDDVDRGALR